MIQNALPKSGNCDGDVPRVDMPYVFMGVESAITEISELRLKQVAAPKRGRFVADAALPTPPCPLHRSTPQLGLHISGVRRLEWPHVHWHHVQLTHFKCRRRYF